MWGTASLASKKVIILLMCSSMSCCGGYEGQGVKGLQLLL